VRRSFIRKLAVLDIPNLLVAVQSASAGKLIGKAETVSAASAVSSTSLLVNVVHTAEHEVCLL
jgi:hypothetical protein